MYRTMLETHQSLFSVSHPNYSTVFIGNIEKQKRDRSGRPVHFRRKGKTQ
jgi:hypothetical protein